MDEYIVKYLLKKNKGMSQSDAEKKAKKIWDDYWKSENGERQELENKKRWDEALNRESYNTFFEYMDNYESDD